jgi:hypothetical protein
MAGVSLKSELAEDFADFDLVASHGGVEALDIVVSRLDAQAFEQPKPDIIIARGSRNRAVRPLGREVDNGLLRTVAIAAGLGRRTHPMVVVDHRLSFAPGALQETAQGKPEGVVRLHEQQLVV